MTNAEMNEKIVKDFWLIVVRWQMFPNKFLVVNAVLDAGDARGLELHHVLSQSSGFVGKDVFDLAELLKIWKHIYSTLKLDQNKND